MAHWKGDGRQALADAIREKDPEKKLEKMEDALLLHFEEVEYVMEHLGQENFSPEGLEKLLEKLREGR